MASSWDGSQRRSRLPPDWPAIRKRVGRRDAWRCQAMLANGEPCGRKATDVDHVRAGDDHSLANLQCLCSWHHAKKSSQEGNAAKALKRRQITNRFVRSEEHPGLL